MMARKKAEVVEDLEEVTEVDEIEAEADEATEGGEKLTAKQAASILKTTGRDLRKFLRKKYGTVGQGQRWEIDPADMPALKTEFEAFAKGGAKETKKTSKDKPAAERPEPVADLDPDELEEISDIEEIEDLDFGDD